MPVCPTCHAEPPYQVVIRDKYVRSNIECVGPYLLGQPNQARRIRNIDSILGKYIDLGVTLWTYLSLLLRVLLLAANCTAIFFAFITYKSHKTSDWKFEIPVRVVVWAEFLVICCYMLWTIWRFLVVVYRALEELHCPPENIYKNNLALCTAVRQFYNALMLLDFNFLLMIRFVTPPAVAAALCKARRRVYGKYGTRVHREECCTDFCCGCCFYGRLIFCTLLQGALVVVVVAGAIFAVFLKVLQLRFLGNADIQNWTITELLLFGQFVVNMAWLDTRQRDRREAKLELLYHGSDSEQSIQERDAVKIVEDIALLVLRYHYSMFTALAIHHALTSEDISYIYVEDNTEADKPRNRVKHEYKSRPDGDATGSLPRGGREKDWQRNTGAGNGRGYVDTNSEMLSGGQVVVEMSPGAYRQGAAGNTFSAAATMGGSAGGAAGGIGSSSSSSDSGSKGGSRLRSGPSAPPLVASMARFPYDFYTYGHAVGSPLRRNMQDPALKERYEQNLWRGPLY